MKKCFYYCNGYCFYGGDNGFPCDTDNNEHAGYCPKKQDEEENNEHAEFIWKEKEAKLKGVIK